MAAFLARLGGRIAGVTGKAKRVVKDVLKKKPKKAKKAKSKDTKEKKQEEQTAKPEERSSWDKIKESFKSRRKTKKDKSKKSRKTRKPKRLKESNSNETKEPVKELDTSDAEEVSTQVQENLDSFSYTKDLEKSVKASSKPDKTKAVIKNLTIEKSILNSKFFKEVTEEANTFITDEELEELEETKAYLQSYLKNTTHPFTSVLVQEQVFLYRVYKKIDEIFGSYENFKNSLSNSIDMIRQDTEALLEVIIDNVSKEIQSRPRPEVQTAKPNLTELINEELDGSLEDYEEPEVEESDDSSMLGNLLSAAEFLDRKEPKKTTKPKEKPKKPIKKSSKLERLKKALKVSKRDGFMKIAKKLFIQIGKSPKIVAKTAAKLGSRFIPIVGWGLLAYDLGVIANSVYKSIQELKNQADIDPVSAAQDVGLNLICDYFGFDPEKDVEELERANRIEAQLDETHRILDPAKFDREDRLQQIEDSLDILHESISLPEPDLEKLFNKTLDSILTSGIETTAYPEYSGSFTAIPNNYATYTENKSLKGIITQGIDFSLLHPELQKRFSSMAYDYNRITGKSFRLNSGKRSLEKQTELYNNFLRTGHPLAAKPNPFSPHIAGIALDANSPELNEADRLGLLKAYGLFRPLLNHPKYPESWHLELDSTRNSAGKITEQTLAKIGSMPLNKGDNKTESSTQADISMDLSGTPNIDYNLVDNKSKSPSENFKKTKNKISVNTVTVTTIS